MPEELISMADVEMDSCQKQTSSETSVRASFERHLQFCLSRNKLQDRDLYDALAQCIKDQMMAAWRDTRSCNNEFHGKKVAYLSLEFLIGRLLGNTVLKLDLEDSIQTELLRYACSLEDIAELELDAGLGNGGLGRLAACFLDSCATMNLPVVGYGIRYEYGMFAQKIQDGYQQERPDRWLRNGCAWEVKAPHHDVTVKFMGRSRSYRDREGCLRYQWVDTQDVMAVAFDIPIAGYRNGRVNTLRLWKAEATNEFNLDEFNAGGYAEAVAAKNQAEQLSMVLYPNDASENGKELRLRQQFFLSSASLQDLMNSFVENVGTNFERFSEFHCIQLNDTHPAVAVPELMRLLLDEQGLSWSKAWEVTTQTMAYTNHTLLPEALERWPVSMFEHILPRHLEIIYEINAHFLRQVARHWPGDVNKLRDMSIIEEGSTPKIRMAYLAIVASFSVNGVAALHTELLKSGLFKNFHALWPKKFNNRTNGVTPRRWLAHSNPRLAQLLDDKIGSGWVTDLSLLSQLNKFVHDEDVLDEWFEIKQANKVDLAALVRRECGIEFDPQMLFDVQVKRIHEYKRQLLNILHVIHLYRRILRGEGGEITPRCVLIGGKAAPGYYMAKLIIKLANNVAQMVNSDPRVKPYLRFAFLPNFNVSAMEKICPGTDLSEQISTAGKEASGTGNMKFMMNGALTIGTLDGANVEILEQVGVENFFLFGLTEQQIEQLQPEYNPNHVIAESKALSDVMELLESGHFNLHEPGLFDPIIQAIRSDSDPWMIAADADSYFQAQERAAKTYQDRRLWTQMSLRNVAASGRFSSDVTIAGYRDEIWDCKAREVETRP